MLGEEQPITGRYAESIEPEFSKAKEILGDRAQSDLDVLSYICFPQQAEQFFEARELKKALVAKYTIEEVK